MGALRGNNKPGASSPAGCGVEAGLDLGGTSTSIMKAAIIAIREKFITRIPI